MRKIAFILSCTGIILCASCKKQASFEKDEVVEKNAHELIVNEDSTFTGEIWDEDHRQCVEMDNGRKTKMLITHATGKVAAERTYSHDGKEETVKFYDENGKELTPKEFAHQYRDLIMQYGEQL